MRKNIIHFLTLIFFSFILSSCEKVIQLDLNTITPQLVIQGNVYDQAGPYTVSISKTVNFDTPNIYPPVNNATVTISDNNGQSEELSQTTDGTYVTTNLQGIVGRTYTLDVKIDGKTYTSSSTMPEAVDIDSIFFKKSFYGGSKLIAINISNLPNKDNYYQVVHLVNGKQIPGFSVFSENTPELSSISYSFMTTGTTPPLVSGDSIEVWLECIDQKVFEY